MTDDPPPPDPADPDPVDREAEHAVILAKFKAELAALPGPPEFGGKPNRPPRHRARALAHGIGVALGWVVRVAGVVVGLAGHGARRSGPGRGGRSCVDTTSASCTTWPSTGATSAPR